MTKTTQNPTPVKNAEIPGNPLISPEEHEKLWSAIVAAHPEVGPLQSPQWAKMNQLIGHKTLALDFGDNDFCLAIIKDARRGRYLEIPAGPLLNYQNTKKVTAVFQKLRELAAENHCVFVRFRPPLENTPENQKLLACLETKTAPMHLAAEHTVVLDLTKPEDELLADFRRQTRYEVRRAAKLNLTVENDNSETIFREFHKIQAETAARQHFVPPNLKTLLAEHEAFGADAKIYIAKDSENHPIAYGLIFATSPEALYYEAASTDLNRKFPGAYALQWQVIRDLKKQGIKRYNLWGIAPPNQPNHRYAGVTTFKTGFGGETVEFIPAQDLVINSLKYSLDLIIEKTRKKRRHL